MHDNDFTSREICKICYGVNAVGFAVPNDIWQVVVPENFRNTIVCLSCFTRLGDEKGVPWDKEIKFFPVSFATHRCPLLGSTVKHRPCSCGSQFKIYRDHENFNGWVLICDNDSQCCEIISVHVNGKTIEDAWKAWDGIK